MNYVPHTEKDKREMLELIGVSSTEVLFSDIPASLRLNQELQISGGLSEIELRRLLKNMAAKNISLDDYICFLGAGAYDHYIPSFIDQLLLRSEFYTAYTPYQPEISQGTLQDIYEYQTMICELTGMEVSNASMYDGASALAEATVMACEQTRRKEFVISEAVHPEYRETVKTYTEAQELVGKPVAFRDGVTAVEDVKAALGPQTAAVVVQYPNFFGNIEDCELWPNGPQPEPCWWWP